MDGTWGVTSTLIEIERWESDRRRRRPDELSGGPAPMPMDDGTRERDEAREEYVPVLWAVGGAGEGEWSRETSAFVEEGAEVVYSRGDVAIVRTRGQ